MADITASVDGLKNLKPISPLIYGSNQPSIRRTCDRLGGNRWTAYNWVNNASNAGNDYHYQSDNFLVQELKPAEQDLPGAAVLGTLRDNATAGRATIVTIPMAGYVSADKKGGGDVHESGADYLKTRFKAGKASKPDGNFSLRPSVASPIVYQDEFVNWVNHHTNGRQQVFYDLDNEPDLWSSTHAEIHPEKLTYAELVQKTVEYASAIKKVSPHAEVLGAVNYGWGGYRNLDNAKDADGRDFQVFFLQQMRMADKEAGRRLVDALDFHWYPEATGLDDKGKPARIFGGGNSAGVASARIQAPRSLWDPSYVESSWITRSMPHNDMAIKLLPRTQAMIDHNDPAIKIAMTEYDFGGGDDISGAIAEADVLGILGKYGVYIANWWDGGDGSRFVGEAMNMYLGEVGNGDGFGDISIGATVSDDARASVYAAKDSKQTSRLTLILINKTQSALHIHIILSNLTAFSNAKVSEINAESLVNGVVALKRLPDMAISNPKALDYSMPALSVTKLVLR